MKTVGFFAYFLTLNRSYRDSRAKIILIQMIYAAVFALVFGILNNFNIIFFMFGFSAFFSAIPLQWARAAKPNLTSLVPLSQRRKTVYTLLSIPAMFVSAILIFGAICFSVWIISGLGAALIAGDAAMILSLLRLYTDGIENVFDGGYAVLLFISMLIFIIGAGTVYSHIDSKKYRNITAIALFAVALTGSEILLQTAMKYSGNSSSVHIAGYAGMYIKYMPMPWLAVLLCALVALSVLGFGVYLVIKKNAPKNY